MPQASRISDASGANPISSTGLGIADVPVTSIQFRLEHVQRQVKNSNLSATQVTLEKGPVMPLLWIIVLILVVLAVGGGVAVNNLLWLVLVVALIVALFAVASGRRV